jgi:hypothetical protein
MFLLFINCIRSVAERCSLLNILVFFPDRGSKKGVKKLILSNSSLASTRRKLSTTGRHKREAVFPVSQKSTCMKDRRMASNLSRHIHVSLRVARR